MTEKRYEIRVRERMQAKFPKELMGGTFRGREYPHIFKALEDNFIDGDFPAKKCLKGDLTDADIKYHYAEHLNSSQAMCISFFKKFFEAEKYEKLLSEILIKQGLEIAGSCGFTDAVFEHIPDPKEGTNFDFYLKLADGRQITWEIKFTESEFGGTTGGSAMKERYLQKYEMIYAPLLPADCTMEEFYKHYQIRRNILYAKNPGDYVLFLTPRENTALDEGRAYIEAYAKKWGTDHIRNLYWEDLLETTLQVVSCEPKLHEYYKKFKEKYFE